jgi:hypothetical protein
MNTLQQLVQATLDARKRAGNQDIGTQVKQGLIQVVRVTYPPEKRGLAVVVPVTSVLPMVEAIRAIEAL